jgi:hypothetical protein
MQPRTSAMDTQSSCPPARMSSRNVTWAVVLDSVIVSWASAVIASHTDVSVVGASPFSAAGYRSSTNSAETCCPFVVRLNQIAYSHPRRSS